MRALSAVDLALWDLLGKSLNAPTDHPYGDRGAGVEDPEGNVWWISTHIEDVAEDEILRRMSQRK